MIQTTVNQANVRVTHDAMNAAGESFVLLQFETPVWGPDGRAMTVPGSNEMIVDQAWTFPIPTEVWPQILEMLTKKPSGLILPEHPGGIIIPREVGS